MREKMPRLEGGSSTVGGGSYENHFEHMLDVIESKLDAIRNALRDEVGNLEYLNLYRALGREEYDSYKKELNKLPENLKELSEELAHYVIMAVFYLYVYENIGDQEAQRLLENEEEKNKLLERFVDRLAKTVNANPNELVDKLTMSILVHFISPIKQIKDRETIHRFLEKEIRDMYSKLVNTQS